MRDPRDVPGAAQDRTRAVAELAELEHLLAARAPRSAWCRPGPGCPCWRCAALRIIRYGVQPA